MPDIEKYKYKTNSGNNNIGDWKIIEYQNIGLGTYIVNNFETNNNYASESGTVGSKYKFCVNATSKMTYEKLTKIQIDVAEKIYKFISGNKNKI